MLSSVDLMRRLDTPDPDGSKVQQLVLVNGPPGSGKDEVGRLFQEFYQGNVYVTKFAKKLKDMTHRAYGSTTFPHDNFESSKNVRNPFFLYITPRDAYIGMSENYMKVMHGSDIFGRLLLQDITANAQDADMIVVTDSGFLEEAQAIVPHFGRENTALIRLSRPGTSYDGDSRGYISLDNMDEMDLENSGTILDLAKMLARNFDRFQMTYHVEVQLPAGTDLMWFEQGKARPSLDQAIAVMESLRDNEYAQRAVRIRCGKSTIVKLAMPGDAPAVAVL